MARRGAKRTRVQADTDREPKEAELKEAELKLGDFHPAHEAIDLDSVCKSHSEASLTKWCTLMIQNCVEFRLEPNDRFLIKSSVLQEIKMVQGKANAAYEIFEIMKRMEYNDTEPFLQWKTKKAADPAWKLDDDLSLHGFSTRTRKRLGEKAAKAANEEDQDTVIDVTTPRKLRVAPLWAKNIVARLGRPISAALPVFMGVLTSSKRSKLEEEMRMRDSQKDESKPPNRSWVNLEFLEPELKTWASLKDYREGYRKHILECSVSAIPTAISMETRLFEIEEGEHAWLARAIANLTMGDQTFLDNFLVAQFAHLKTGDVAVDKALRTVQLRAQMPPQWNGLLQTDGRVHGRFPN